MANRVTPRPRTGIKPGKPRTLTGRVAIRMMTAIKAAYRDINLADFEYGLMLGAALATEQNLTPADFDNDQGTDALAALFAMLTKEHAREKIFVTPEWRRVVIAARRYAPGPERPSERFWSWKHPGDATTMFVVGIPVPGSP